MKAIVYDKSEGSEKQAIQALAIDILERSRVTKQSIISLMAASSAATVLGCLQAGLDADRICDSLETFYKAFLAIVIAQNTATRN